MGSKLSISDTYRISYIDLREKTQKVLKKSIEFHLPINRTLVYSMTVLLCLVFSICIYGRVELGSRYQYRPIIKAYAEPQELATTQIQELIDTWREKRRKANTLIRRRIARYTIPYLRGPIIYDSDLKILLNKCSAKYQVDMPLILALMKVESNFEPRALSHAGARGLMQLMPDTARQMGLIVNGTIDERLNPNKNIAAGVHYLKLMLDRFDNPVEAIAAYNIGPEVVKRGMPSNRETLQHVYKVTRQQYRYEQNVTMMYRDINLMVRKCERARLVMKSTAAPTISL